MIDEIFKVLPKYISNEIIRLNCSKSITEIRLRTKSKVIIICSKKEFVLDCLVSPKTILEILLNVSKNSIYAIQNDINKLITTNDFNNDELIIQKGKKTFKEVN